MKLALMGKSIAHSQSVAFYKTHLPTLSAYDLWDIPSEDQLPPVSFLKQAYDGINITAPYKRFYASQVQLNSEMKDLGVINCIRLKDLTGTNTDFLALKQILPLWISKPHDQIFILGDGSMSDVLAVLLTSMKKSFQILSRKKGFNLELISSDQLSKKPIIINSCSRSFPFNGHFPKDSHVFDLNYGHTIFSQKVKSQSLPYEDGQSLFELQGKFALSFWNF
jgi:shikimate 5-dehydrogenase